MRKQPRERHDYYGDLAQELAKAAKLVLPPQAIPESEQYVMLKRSEMLAELSDAELWELARAAHWSRAPKGTVVLRENDAMLALMQAMHFKTENSAEMGVVVLSKDLASESPGPH